jgi:hypothetical protein
LLAVSEPRRSQIHLLRRSADDPVWKDAESILLPGPAPWMAF